MTEPPLLRDYQLRTLTAIEEAIRAGCRAPLVVLPTGAGKTVIAAQLMKTEVQRSGRAMFLAPRRELVMQTSRKLEDLGQSHGILLAGLDERRDLFQPIQVGSIDTMLARFIRHKRLVLPDPTLVLVDEAHLSITKHRKELLDLWPSAIRIGFCATPARKDGRALGSIYDALIEPATVADLQADGYLVGARYFTLSQPDLESVRMIAGDYHAGELEEAVNQPKLVGDVVAHWLKLAAGRRTVVFATSIKHSIALCEEFLRAGVAAEHVDADTPQELRDATFERFRAGETQVLTNCFLASYGFDLPELSCVVMARPTRSLMLYLQMLGRGLRPAQGKTDCLVLDHSGCVHRHGFAHDARAWTLEGESAVVETPKSARERGDLKILECPECHCNFCGARLCPECGYFFAPKGKEVRNLAGELVEIGEHLERDQQDRLAFFAELKGIGAERGYKPGWAAYKFKERFEEWPPRSFEAVTPAMPTLETRRWVKSRVIAWRKAQERDGYQQPREAVR